MMDAHSLTAAPKAAKRFLVFLAVGVVLLLTGLAISTNGFRDWPSWWQKMILNYELDNFDPVEQQVVLPDFVTEPPTSKG